MKQLRELFNKLVKWLEQLKVRWLKLSTAERWVLLISATLAFSKSVVLKEGLDGQFWTIASTFGALFAAVAAYRTAVATQATLDHQMAREEEEKRPNLILSDARMFVNLESREPDELYGGALEPYVSLTFNASNISQHSVNIYEVVFDSPTEATKPTLPKIASINSLVAPGKTEEIKAKANTTFHAGAQGEVTVFFYYGATGPVPHALKWRYMLKRLLNESDDKSTSDHEFFTKQTYVKPENAEKIREQLLIRTVQNMGSNPRISRDISLRKEESSGDP